MLKEIPFTAGSPNLSNFVLQPDDYQYLRDRSMHYRNYQGHLEEMSIEGARAYEAAKTIVTAFEHLSLTLPFAYISITVNTKDACVVGEAHMYEHPEPFKFQISFKRFNDEYDPVGRFFVSRIMPAYTRVLTEYSVNDSEMVSYDMVFPAPTNFRCQMEELLNDC